jgi:hypothetical protein
MPIKMKSMKSHRYGTRMMAAGDEYEVPGESMARLVEALQWSKRAPAVAPAPVAPPAPAPAPEPAPVAAKTTRGRGRWGRAVEQVEQVESPVEPASPAANDGVSSSVGTLDETKTED